MSHITFNSHLHYYFILSSAFIPVVLLHTVPFDKNIRQIRAFLEIPAFSGF